MDRKKFKERDKIIFDKAVDWKETDIIYFKALSVEKLEALMNGGHADPEDRQNEAPTFFWLTEWLKKNPKFRAHGYALTPERSDYRVSLEGVESVGELTEGEKVEFLLAFKHAEECDISREGVARAWFD